MAMKCFNIKCNITFLTFGEIQYFSKSNDQVSHCSIAVFNHLTQTGFSEQVHCVLLGGILGPIWIDGFTERQ